METLVLNNGNALHVDYDISKIFIGENKYEAFTFDNNTGAGPSDFEPGLLLGREQDTGNVVPLNSANAALGEAIPIGILAQKITQLAADGTQANVAVCVFGLVSEDKLILQNGGDSLDTVISLKRLRDRILGDTMGIKLIDADDLTGFDNQ